MEKKRGSESGQERHLRDRGRRPSNHQEPPPPATGSYHDISGGQASRRQEGGRSANENRETVDRRRVSGMALGNQVGCDSTAGQRRVAREARRNGRRKKRQCHRRVKRRRTGSKVPPNKSAPTILDAQKPLRSPEASALPTRLRRSERWDQRKQASVASPSLVPVLPEARGTLIVRSTLKCIARSELVLVGGERGTLLISGC